MLFGKASNCSFMSLLLFWYIVPNEARYIYEQLGVNPK
jgi:hypothetical protein